MVVLLYSYRFLVRPRDVKTSTGHLSTSDSWAPEGAALPRIYCTEETHFPSEIETGLNGT